MLVVLHTASALAAALVNRLVCPLCKARLRAASFPALLCDGCTTWYPIVSSIPVLLDFPTQVHEAFADEHRAELGAIQHRPPRGEPRPGEESVQETFTDEWAQVRESKLSFTYTPDELVALNEQVWLPWLRDVDVASVLDVGCGLGHETVALQRATGAREVIGVDSNIALLSSRVPESAPAGVHFVVASLFALPFEKASFDLVYSQGVLHHTFSTREAFGAVAPFARDGGRLFVWLYALEDHLAGQGRRGVAMRVGVTAERALRPFVSRAPARVRDAFFRSATALAHPVLRPRMRHAAAWTQADTDTFLRDWLSPPFAHRHGWNEVIGWFEECGFEIVSVQSPTRYRELFGEPLWGVGLTGLRTAAA